jgi:hypothetical protein
MTTMATVEVRLGPMMGDEVEPLADALMEALDAHPAVVGPMVVADLERGDVMVSFEFAASGDVKRDRPRAMRILDAVLGGRNELRASLGSAPTFSLGFVEA